MFDESDVEALRAENAKLKADYLALTERHQREINGWCASLQQRDQELDRLKMELARLREVMRGAIGECDRGASVLSIADTLELAIKEGA